MKLENRCLVPASKDAAWALVMDIPRAAACVPGMQEVAAEGADRFRATLRVRVGPMGLNLAGTVQVLERNEEKGEARFLVEASDRRVGGALRSNLIMRLTPQTDQQTELTIISDTTFMGRLGELGQPIIRRKASATMEDFARNLARQIDNPPAKSP
jgi:carbon monoxide dehydrogenase subunit G